MTALEQIQSHIVITTSDATQKVLRRLHDDHKLQNTTAISFVNAPGLFTAENIFKVMREHGEGKQREVLLFTDDINPAWNGLVGDLLTQYKDVLDVRQIVVLHRAKEDEVDQDEEYQEIIQIIQKWEQDVQSAGVEKAPQQGSAAEDQPQPTPNFRGLEPKVEAGLYPDHGGRDFAPSAKEFTPLSDTAIKANPMRLSDMPPGFAGSTPMPRRSQMMRQPQESQTMTETNLDPRLVERLDSIERQIYTRLTALSRQVEAQDQHIRHLQQAQQLNSNNPAFCPPVFPGPLPTFGCYGNSETSTARRYGQASDKGGFNSKLRPYSTHMGMSVDPSENHLGIRQDEMWAPRGYRSPELSKPFGNFANPRPPRSQPAFKLGVPPPPPGLTHETKVVFYAQNRADFEALNITLGDLDPYCNYLSKILILTPAIVSAQAIQQHVLHTSIPVVVVGPGNAPGAANTCAHFYHFRQDIGSKAKIFYKNDAEECIDFIEGLIAGL